MSEKKEKAVETNTEVENASAVETPLKKFKFKKIKAVNRGLLKFSPNKPIYIKAESAMVQSEKHPKDKSDKTPPVLMDIVDLQTGEEAQIICGEVVKSELEKHYPNNEFIGKCFEITQHEPEAGKQYRKYSIVEIEVS